MKMRPALPLLWQRPLAHFGLLALLLVGAAAWYVMARGGWVNALGLPPVLDASTPHTQGGFSLLDVQLPGQQKTRYGQAFAGFQFQGIDFQKDYGPEAVDTADAVGLWIKPPSLPDGLPAGGSIDSQLNTLGKAFLVTARLSTGDVLPLEWHLRSTTDWPTGTLVKRLLFVTLPSGYSDACQFVDFTISDQGGHSARWRIARLPRMHHAVPPPSAFTDTITRDGVAVSARAWHEANSQIGYVLRPVLPPNSHQWDVVTTSEWHEWEPFAYDGRVKVYKDSGAPVLGRNGIFDTGFGRWYSGGIHNYAGFDFYPRMDRFLRLTCELRQFETCDETVTFHNINVKRGQQSGLAFDSSVDCLLVSHSMTLTTPSGVSVTLPTQGQSAGPMMSEGCLNFVLTVKAFDKPTSFARSPLVRQFGKPVTTSVHFAPPYISSGQTLNPGDTQTYNLRPAINPAWHITPKDIPRIPIYLDVPPVLKDFTVIVRQRVDLQTIPMTFTLPIAAEAPAYYPKGYRLPRRPSHPT